MQCPECGKSHFIQKSVENKRIYPKIFVSHAWDHSHRYCELLDILNLVFKSKWRNYSIPADKAFELASQPHIRTEQQREQVFNRIHEIKKMVKSLETERKSLDNKQRELVKKYRYLIETNLIEKDDELQSKYPLAQNAQVRLKEFSHSKSNNSKKDIEFEIDSVQDELINYEPNISDIQIKLTKLEIELVGLERYQENDRLALDIFSIYPRNIYGEGSRKQNAFREHPSLALAIHEKISSADICIIIVTKNSDFKYWIDFEMEIASYTGKKLFGLIDEVDFDRLPADFLNLGMQSLSWDKAEIRDAIISFYK